MTAPDIKAVGEALQRLKNVAGFKKEKLGFALSVNLLKMDKERLQNALDANIVGILEACIQIAQTKPTDATIKNDLSMMLHWAKGDGIVVARPDQGAFDKKKKTLEGFLQKREFGAENTNPWDSSSGHYYNALDRDR